MLIAFQPTLVSLFIMQTLSKTGLSEVFDLDDFLLNKLVML